MRRDESGAVAIVVALMSVVLFGFAALVVDVGNASDIREQASAAADAGVLAGESYLAGAVSPDGSLSDPAAAQLATVVEGAVDANYSAARDGWASCADSSIPAAFTSVPTSPCVEYEVVTSASGQPVGTSVRVRIPVRHVPSTFGGIFGVGSISVSPVSAARAGQDPPSPCQPCDPRLDDLSGQPVPPEASLPDTVQQLLPGALSIEPPISHVDANGCPTAAGRYDKDVDVTGAVPCALPPGLYVFNDSSLTVAASVPALTGTNVTLLFYGTDPDPLMLATSSANLVAVRPGLGLAACGSAIPGVVIVINEDGAAVAPVSSPPVSPSVTGSVTPTDTTSASGSTSPTDTASSTVTGTASATTTPTDSATATAPVSSSAPTSPSASSSASGSTTPSGSATTTGTPTVSPSPTATPPAPPTPSCSIPAAPATTKRSFDLGPSFDFTGSVYAVDGETTWVTASGECTVALDCRIRDDGQSERIAVTATNFGGDVTPTVLADHDQLLAPPQPEHLSE